MVDLLWLAHDEACVATLAGLVTAKLAAGRPPDAATLKRRLAPRRRELPEAGPVAFTALAQFDTLLEAQA